MNRRCLGIFISLGTMNRRCFGIFISLGMLMSLFMLINKFGPKIMLGLMALLLVRLIFLSGLMTYSRACSSSMSFDLRHYLVSGFKVQVLVIFIFFQECSLCRAITRHFVLCASRMLRHSYIFLQCHVAWDLWKPIFGVLGRNGNVPLR